jgi:hypothetical protein
LAWFNDNLQAVCNNNSISNFSKHLLENQHPVDTTDNYMEILYTPGKISTQQKKITSMKKQKTTNLTLSLRLPFKLLNPPCRVILRALKKI